MEKGKLVATYRIAKTQYPSHVVLVQVGNFYEAVGADANIVAKVCDLTVTTLDGVEGGVAICGVPVINSRGYLDRLLDYGYAVAVVEREPTRLSIEIRAKIYYPLV